MRNIVTSGEAPACCSPCGVVTGPEGEAAQLHAHRSVMVDLGRRGYHTEPPVMNPPRQTETDEIFRSTAGGPLTPRRVLSGIS